MISCSDLLSFGLKRGEVSFEASCVLLCILHRKCQPLNHMRNLFGYAAACEKIVIV